MTAHATREDLAAYSIGGLDPDEERLVAEHAAGCEQCRSELAHLAPAVAVLAESVEQLQPPPELRERLVATVRAEAAPAEKTVRAPKRSRFDLRSLLMRPAAGLAVAAIAIAALGGYLIAEGGDPETQTVPITEAAGDSSGELVLSDGGATLRVQEMPQLSRGSVYQVWVADSQGEVTPSATFLPHGDGNATADVPELGDDAAELLVTAEPGPNRTEPTLPPVLGVALD